MSNSKLMNDRKTKAQIHNKNDLILPLHIHLYIYTQRLRYILWKKIQKKKQNTKNHLEFN